MIDPDKIAEFDQAMAGLRHELPKVARSYYEGLVEEGFTGEQAMMLVRDYISAFMVPRGREEGK